MALWAHMLLSPNLGSLGSSGGALGSLLPPLESTACTGQPALVVRATLVSTCLPRALPEQ